jgi:tetraacyldisaccharide 4'-kinase
MRGALSPAAILYDLGQRLRWRLTSPFDPQVPVICVGNAMSGGAGKTPFCLLLQRLLAARDIQAAFLTRGYGGRVNGPQQVSERHSALDVGDEALLLAAAAPTFVAKARAAGAEAAAAAGADVLIMDDGFQNPTVRKALSFLLLGGDERELAPFPLGPMREPLARAAARADALVLPAEKRESVMEDGKTIFYVQRQITASVPPQPVVAFCGIARPDRFFRDLEQRGFEIAGRAVFPDHHPYKTDDISALRTRAKTDGAALITTEKDLVRLRPIDRADIAVARLDLVAEDPDRLILFVRERIGL